MIEKLKELIQFYRERADIANDMIDESLKDGNEMRSNIMFGYKKGLIEVTDEVEKIVQEFSNEGN